MRVLWITYAALGRAAELLENKKTQSGTWIDATTKEIIKCSDMELFIACISNSNETVVDVETGVTYVGVGNIRRQMGCIPKALEVTIWKSLIEKIHPDLIMVWGTEFSNGLAITKAAMNIPILFFIQGVLGKITSYPLGLLKVKEITNEIGLLGAIKLLHFKKNGKLQKAQKDIEKEMLQNAVGIIVDNDWATYYYKAVINNVKTYFYPLPINKVFLENECDFEKREKYSIFTIDGSNPAKGVFQLIKALQIVKTSYPEVKLYIPGHISSRTPAILYESPYLTYLKKIIRKYGLENNVIFLGQQTGEQMRDWLAKCHVFVMPSSIENHSSSLREAMYMGVPCVSSLVGSVMEFTTYGENALTYRYGEIDSLAGCILRVFEDDDMARRLGNVAKEKICKKYPQDDLGVMLKNIYEEVRASE